MLDHRSRPVLVRPRPGPVLVRSRSGPVSFRSGWARFKPLDGDGREGGRWCTISSMYGIGRKREGVPL